MFPTRFHFSVSMTVIQDFGRIAGVCGRLPWLGGSVGAAQMTKTRRVRGSKTMARGLGPVGTEATTLSRRRSKTSTMPVMPALM